VEYARHLLDHPGLSALDPFVPNAILRTLESDPATAQELARDYFKTVLLSDEPDSIHAAVASGDRWLSTRSPPTFGRFCPDL
jgi:hypothetical protein